jgi:hypothetical protein
MRLENGISIPRRAMDVSRHCRIGADRRAIHCLSIIDQQNPTPYSYRNRKREAAEGIIAH